MAADGRTEGSRTTTEWSQDAINTTIARYTAMAPEQLLAEVERLARLAQAGEADWSDVDQLVMSLRVLQRRERAHPKTGFDPAARYGSYLRRNEGPRLEYIHDPQYGTDQRGRMISLGWRVEKQGYGYASTTAGQLRETFTSGETHSPDEWLDYTTLRTLPYPLPADDDAPVVVYELRQHVAQLLNQLGKGKDIARNVQRLSDRLVRGILYPSEDPYSFRD